MTTDHQIIFEIPANDIVRTSFKFEHLWELANNYAGNENSNCNFISISSMANILILFDKPELRSKYVQEFNRFKISLEKFTNNPNIEQDMLNKTLEDINNTLSNLNNDRGKFIKSLRDNEFFKTIMQYHNLPGGLSSFNTPGLHLWLTKSKEERLEMINHWLEHFYEIKNTVYTFLELVRNCGHFKSEQAENGFYQQAIDNKTPCHLVRIKSDHDLNMFPKVSIGQHGISVRFYDNKLNQKPTQTAKAVDFKLACCLW